MSLRNPPAYARMAIVASVLAVPGMLGGAMAALFLGTFPVCIVVGGLLGALSGVLLEGWPRSPDGTDNLGDESDQYAHKMKELESQLNYWRRNDQP
ncbi:MAG: hypothetical protein AB7K24_20605 [Gemmataceae bacterium]